jgi:stage V sporulation protein SpoVS
MGADNFMNVGSAVEEDNVMTGFTTFNGIEMIYRPAFRKAQVNLDVAP